MLQSMGLQRVRHALVTKKQQQQCPKHRCQGSWSWSVLWRPRRPPRTNSKKWCPILHRILECKSRKSRYTWCNREVFPWIIKWCCANTNRILPRECTDHSKHTFQQHKRRLYTWALANGQYWIRLITFFCSWRWKRCIQSAKTRPGVHCGSDHQLLVAKFRLNLKKVGKTLGQSGMT